MSENENTPLDLSTVVNLLTAHPNLLSDISGMLKGIGNTTEEKPSEAETPPRAAEPVFAEKPGNRGARHELLHALKPYLSDRRSKAMDSMEVIADLLDTVRGK